MQSKVAQANINKFIALLETETDPTKRRVITALLAEETAKLEALTQAKAKEG